MVREVLAAALPPPFPAGERVAQRFYLIRCCVRVRGRHIRPATRRRYDFYDADPPRPPVFDADTLPILNALSPLGRVMWSGRVIVGALMRRFTLASPVCVSVPSE